MRPYLRALLVATGLFTVPAASAARAATLLRLDASASVAVTADRLRASLRADQRGTDAASTQAAVNRMIAQAILRARAVKSVHVSTGGYRVWHLPPPDGRWQASQTLILAGADPQALLALAGSLQAKGLVIESLSWGLARQTAAAAEQRAMALAIARLRARARQAAKLLGLRFDHFREVTLGGGGPPPPRPMLFSAARAAPAPSALAGPERVRASVSAVAVLGED
ncbi:MAG: SIMPL domain-containing protein [Acetobacteraceae bacterium]